MIDIATLGFKAETGDLARADRDMQKVERTGDKLQDRVDKIGKSFGGLGGKITQTIRSVLKFDEAGARVIKTIGSIAAKATIAGAALVGAFVGSALPAFAKFESGFNNVVTLLDDSSFKTVTLTEGIHGLEQGLLELRGSTGETFDNLNKGLFDLVSAGIAAEQSITTLNTAFELALAGGTNTAVAVDGITSALNAYSKEASEARRVAEGFFTAQKFGKTTIEELSKELGDVAPIANTLGVSFEETLAALSAITTQAIKTPQAASGLAAAFASIAKPAEQAVAAAERLGIGFDLATLKAKGLTQFVNDIFDAVEARGTDQDFADLFGSVEAFKVIAALRNASGQYKNILTELNDETKAAATFQEALRVKNAEALQVFKRFAGEVQSLQVELAGALAPAVSDITDKLTKFVASIDGAALGKAIQGGVKALGNAWRIVSEAIFAATGAVIAYTGVSLVQTILTTNALAAAWTGVRNAIIAAQVVGFTRSIKAISGMIASVTGLRAAFLALNAVIIANPIGIVIAAAVAAIILFRKEIAQLIGGTRDVGVVIKATFDVIGERVANAKTALGNLFQPVLNAARQVGAIIGDVAEYAISAGRALIDMVPEPVLAAMRGLLNIVRQLVAAFVQFQLAVLSITPIGLLAKGAKEQLEGVLKDIRERSAEIEKQASIKIGVDTAEIDAVPQHVADVIASIGPQVFDQAIVSVRPFTAEDLFRGEPISTALAKDAQKFIDGLPDQLAELENSLKLDKALAGIDQTAIAELERVKTRMELVFEAAKQGIDLKVNPAAMAQIEEIADAAGRLAAQKYQINFTASLDQSVRDLENELKLNVKLAGLDPRDVSLIERTRAEFEALSEAAIAFGPDIPNEVLEKIERYADLVAQARREQEALNAASDLRDLARDFRDDGTSRAYERQINVLRESLSIADNFKAIEIERVRQISAATAELERQKAVLATLKPTDAGYEQITAAILEAETALGRLSEQVTADAIEQVRALREEILQIDDVLVGAVDDIFSGKFSFKDFFKDLKRAAIADLVAPIKTSIQESIRRSIVGPPVEPRRVTSAIETGANAADFTVLGNNLASEIERSVSGAVDQVRGQFDFASSSIFDGRSNRGEIDTLGGFFESAIGSIDLKPFGKDLSKELSKSVDGVTFDAGSLTTSLNSALSDINLKPLENKFGGIFDSVLSSIPPITIDGRRTPTAAPAGTQESGGILSAISNGFSGLKNSFSSLFGQGGPLGGVGKLFSGATNALGGALGGITKAIGGIGGAIGGVLSKVASVAGPVGQIVGTVATAVSFFKDLFGKPSNKVGQVVFDPSTGSVKGTGTKDQSEESLRNLEIAQAISTSISEVIQSVLKATGGKLADSAATAFRDDLLNIAAGSRDGIQVGFQGANGEIALRKTFEATEDGAAKAIDAGIRLILDKIKGGDQELLNDFKKMKEITAEMVDDLLRVAARREELEAEFLTYLEGAAGETLRAFNELKRRQQSERVEVDEIGGFSQKALLGFELKLQQERVKFLSELSETQREALRGVVTDTEFALADLLGLVNTELETVNENVIDTAAAFDRAKQSIRDFLAELDFGQFSNLSPREQFDQSISEFRSTLSRARIGDADALSEITAIAQRTLGLAQDLYASGPRFQSIREEVIGALRELDQLPRPEPATADNSPVVDELARIRDLVNLALDAGAGTLDFAAVREALAGATTLDPSFVQSIENALGRVEANVPSESFSPVNNAISLSGNQVSSAILSQSPLLAQIAINTGLIASGQGKIAENTGQTTAGIAALYDASIQPQAQKGGQSAPTTVPVGLSPTATATSAFSAPSTGVGRPGTRGRYAYAR